VVGSFFFFFFPPVKCPLRVGGDQPSSCVFLFFCYSPLSIATGMTAPRPLVPPEGHQESKRECLFPSCFTPFFPIPVVRLEALPSFSFLIPPRLDSDDFFPGRLPTLPPCVLSSMDHPGHLCPFSSQRTFLENSFTFSRAMVHYYAVRCFLPGGLSTPPGADHFFMGFFRKRTQSKFLLARIKVGPLFPPDDCHFYVSLEFGGFKDI